MVLQIATDRTSTFLIADGDDLYVPEGVSIVVDGVREAAITHDASDIFGHSITIDGYVLAENGAGLQLWDGFSVPAIGGHSVFIGETGVLESRGLGSTISAQTPEDLHIENHGQILGDGVFINSGNVHFVNRGVVDANAGFDVGFSNFFFVNTGTMTGSSPVSFYESSGRMINSGVIESTFSTAVWITDEGFGGVISIVNQGEIHTATEYAILSDGFGVERISNVNLIAGDVATGYGDDSVQNIVGLIDGDVVLGEGRDRFVARNGDVSGTVYGGADNDVLIGGSQDDRLNGGAQSDVLGGGAGEDVLNGGADGDRLTGGAGSDCFVFESDFGPDAITDFEDNVDSVKLDAGLWGGGLTRAQVVAQFGSVENGHVKLDFGDNNEILFLGFSDLRALTNDLVLI